MTHVQCFLASLVCVAGHHWETSWKYMLELNLYLKTFTSWSIGFTLAPTFEMWNVKKNGIRIDHHETVGTENSFWYGLKTINPRWHALGTSWFAGWTLEPSQTGSSTDPGWRRAVATTSPIWVQCKFDHHWPYSAISYCDSRFSDLYWQTWSFEGWSAEAFHPLRTMPHFLGNLGHIGNWLRWRKQSLTSRPIAKHCDPDLELYPPDAGATLLPTCCHEFDMAAQIFRARSKWIHFRTTS